MRVLIKKENQYRTIQTRFLNFDFDVKHLEFVGYVKNDVISKYKGVTVFNFDTISYLSTSERGFIHCVGLVGKQIFQIVLKNRI
jgi:hypothetical protein